MQLKSVCIVLALLLIAVSAASIYYYTVSSYENARLLADLGATQSRADDSQARSDTLQADLSRTQADLAKAQAQVKLLQTELDATQTKLRQVQGEVDSANAGREKARDDMVAAQSETLSLQRRLARIRLYGEIINALFVPSLTGEMARMPARQVTELLRTWQSKVDAAGDPRLLEKFKAVKDSNMADAAMRDLFLYVFKAIPAT